MKPAPTPLRPEEIARIENAILELFAAFGQSVNTIQNSLQSNRNDGLISAEIVIPGINLFGIPLGIDHKRTLREGMYVRVKKPELNAGGGAPPPHSQNGRRADASL